jgi:hypothetical protein
MCHTWSTHVWIGIERLLQVLGQRTEVAIGDLHLFTVISTFCELNRMNAGEFSSQFNVALIFVLQPVFFSRMPVF